MSIVLVFEVSALCQSSYGYWRRVDRLCMDVGVVSIVLWMSAIVDCSVGVLSIVPADVSVALTVVVLSTI